MFRAIWALLQGIIMTILSGCDIQRNLLYYPGQITIADVQRYAAGNDLRLWPVENAGYSGLVSRMGPDVSRGTVVVFHGNAGAAAYRDYYVTALEGLGYRVVLAEYPGYGGRISELSEKSLVADARETAARAREEFGGPLYLWGESLGCGVASALAADPVLRPQGVILLTPWDSLLHEAQAQFPWLPVRLLMRDVYDNVANLASYTGPVAVIMAGRDEVIPNRLTENLFRSLVGPKRIWTFANAGHNDWPSQPGLAWWGEVMDFVRAGQ